MKSKASAVWHGGLKDGKGALNSESGVLEDTPYSFQTRFEGKPGTNPEELIAAAHAGCFTMALSMQLGEAGITADALETHATVTLNTEGNDLSVTNVDLEVTATIPGGDKAAFEKAAAEAKEGCPISKLLKAEISLTTTFNG